MKEKLKAGEAVAGAFNNLQTPSVVEILGLIGLDFVIIDAEHTSVTPETAENLYRAAEVRNMSVVTRIGENSQQVIQKFMDAGSQGVLIPLVNTRDEAQRVVDSVKYPPIGKRGLAGSRAAEWGLTNTADYVKTANEETLVAVQVETLESVKNFNQIVSLDHIDVIFFGPADLSTAMGFPGQPRHPDVLALIERLGKETLAAGKASGTIARDINDYKYWRERGFQWLCTGASSFLTRGAQEYVSNARQYETQRK
jgi:4-hydroxy-2-oxoheptanedioate aldolase